MNRSFPHWPLSHVAAALVALIGCRQAAEAPPTNVVIRQVASLPSEPSDPAWRQAVEFDAKLIPQDMVEPRLLAESTAGVRVRALTDGRDLAVRLEWDDASKDDVPGPAKFFDACAIQVPADVQSTVPAPQMGETGRPVHISYWNAVWQASVDGRPDSLAALYPNAAVDHYPFEAESLKKDPAAQQAMAARYAPARTLGNPMAGPRESPVEDMIAEGPSTLTRSPEQASRGRGVKTATGWSVQIVRPLPASAANHQPGQIAFAVWRGDAREVGARKMRTAWIELSQEEIHEPSASQ